QQSLPACNVLFWNQVIQANQFIFPALGPLIFRFSCGGRILLVLRCTHFSFLCYQYPCQVAQNLVWTKMGDGFLLNPEAVTQRFLTENKQLSWQIQRMWEFILRPLRFVF